MDYHVIQKKGDWTPPLKTKFKLVKGIFIT